ncbi:alpha/beta hydrolase [Flavobacterium sp. PLA-1-15]|uniref:alpha/beta hydrolase n=1 Tax=Flavobacterium sp. PLA-1-15 TaxID=3380533 RepID=UPI003B779EED
MQTLIITLMFLVSKTFAYSQKIPEDFGYRHLKFKYQNDPVDIIVISKPGEEKIAKPLFLFCQGSLPQPVVKYDETGLYGTLPFDETPFLEEYHIVIIAKPFIPIIANVNKLGENYMYLKDDEKKLPPKGYVERNYLDYYVFRNNSILKQLFKERWVRTSKLLVAGHSEGSTIASKMASINKKVTHLIYSGGNPYGRIMNMLSQSRSFDNDTLNEGDNTIEYWKKVVENPNEIDASNGDSNKTTYSFSLPQKDNLMGLKIPVLVTYGTKDWSASFNDLFQIEAIRERKQNLSFKSYLNLEHNYFPIDKNGTVNEEIYNWDKIASDWLDWLEKTNK